MMYKDAGLSYDYLSVKDITKGNNTHFREVISRKALRGDLIVFLPGEGNLVDSGHVGVITEVDTDGNVVKFVSASTRTKNKISYAANRRSGLFKKSNIEYPPEYFQNPENQQDFIITWRIYRWKN
jgi:hypothetical protein